jgi:7,8-dihydropterin-6-yl-methyl-4-(beta-D-ribofuranosyl)aminobenzene 5'-phosphate synthase
MQRPSVIVISALTLATIALGITAYKSPSEQRKGQAMNEQREAVSRAPGEREPTPGGKDLTIKVVYDNNPYAKGLETAWGFSALITGTEKTILFDTGGNGQLLLDNMKKLAVDPNRVDVVVLSHIHGDHTGGLGSFLRTNANVTVYLPISFPKRFKENVQSCGAKVVEVKEPVKICENVHSTGQMGKWIKEHSLMIRTKAGLIVMTGCAHPGIVNIVNKTKETVKDDILLVMGGFHLEWATKSKIEKIISAFKQWHVQYVGPCHCSGHKARSLFEKHYGKNYIKIGVGKSINLRDLQ